MRLREAMTGESYSKTWSSDEERVKYRTAMLVLWQFIRKESYLSEEEEKIL